jgi:hypothetical protein
MKKEPANMTAAGIMSQKLKLFMRAKANLQRNHPVCKTHKGRHDGAKHHDQTVHGGELIEQLRVDQLQSWLVQLNANEQGQNAANHEHGEAEQQVQSTDVFVVGRKHPTAPAFWGTMVVVVTVGMIVRM